MQDCLRIKNELAVLRERFHENLRVIPSRDKWNPAAAIVLANFVMPPGVEPGVIDVRVPIPALYGFSAVPTYALFQQALIREGERVPFCRLLESDELEKNLPYLVDFRERRDWPEQVHALCLSPEWRPGRVAPHIDLMTFLEHIRAYLVNPRALLLGTLREWRTRAAGGAGPELYLRIAYFERELGYLEQARESIARGRRLFPDHADFDRLEIP